MVEISIIIPVYKAEKHIERCVESILNQTFKDFELILVNDGSPDRSGEICEILAKRDKRIRVIHKENGGVSSARNIGLDVAKGRYIMFCDSDDYVKAEWCQCLYDLIYQENVSLAFCGFQSVDGATGHKGKVTQYSEEEKVIVSRTEYWNIYTRCLSNVTWNKIYRKDVIEENNLRFDETIQYGEDFLFVLAYIKCSKGEFGICNLPLYYYIRGNNESLSNKYVPRLWEFHKKAFTEMADVVVQCGINLNSIKEEYYSKWIWAIAHSLNNNARRKGIKNIGRVIQENNQILSSEECSKAFMYGNFNGYNKLYVFLLKQKNYYFIIIFNFLFRIRQLLRKWNNLLIKKF